MDDLETLRRAETLLGQYGFEEVQAELGKAIRIIAATARRLNTAYEEHAKTVSGSSQGDRLKRLRERAGYTRSQFAEICGVVMSTVRAHENGGNNIPEDAARAYAKALGASPSLILRGGE